jgi:hypothetical protein
MTARLIVITAWLAAGHLLVAGLFWGFLQVPESNVAMLALSACAVLAMVVVGGYVEGVGVAAWSPGAGWRDAVRGAALAPMAFAVGLAVFAGIWWMTARAGTAWTAHRGEIDAWLMLHLRWTRTAGLHTMAAWVLGFVRYVVGASLALAPVAAIGRGPRALARVGTWLAAALSPRRLLLLGLLFYGLVWLPWRAVSWRPARLAPNWQEPAFLAIKLAVLYVVSNVGWAAILKTVSTSAGADGRPQAS